MQVPEAFPIAAGLFAYGPVPGVELIPYFLALLAWIGFALGALFLSPIMAAVRVLRRACGFAPAAPKVEPGEPAPPTATVPAPPLAPTPEPPVEGPRDHG